MNSRVLVVLLVAALMSTALPSLAETIAGNLDERRVWRNSTPPLKWLTLIRTVPGPDGVLLATGYVSGGPAFDTFTAAVDVRTGVFKWISHAGEPDPEVRDEGRVLAVDPDGSRVYSGGWTGWPSSTGRVVAHDAASGEIQWTAVVPKFASTTSERVEALAAAEDGPVLAGVWSTRSSALVALDRVNGDVLWRTELGQGKYRNVHAIASVAETGNAYVAYDEEGWGPRLAAIDLESGAVIWSKDVSGSGGRWWMDIDEERARVLVGSRGVAASAYRASDGHRVWSSFGVVGTEGGPAGFNSYVKDTASDRLYILGFEYVEGTYLASAWGLDMESGSPVWMGAMADLRVNPEMIMLFSGSLTEDGERLLAWGATQANQPFGSFIVSFDTETGLVDWAAFDDEHELDRWRKPWYPAVAVHDGVMAVVGVAKDHRLTASGFSTHEEDNVRPTPRAAYPAATNVNFPVQLDATASTDADGAVAGVIWTLPDASFVGKWRMEHQFTDVGEQCGRLTVFDDRYKENVSSFCVDVSDRLGVEVNVTERGDGSHIVDVRVTDVNGAPVESTVTELSMRYRTSIFSRLDWALGRTDCARWQDGGTTNATGQISFIVPPAFVERCLGRDPTLADLPTVEGYSTYEVDVSAEFRGNTGAVEAWYPHAPAG